ncbi:cytochrome C [Geomonas sp. RF6]|uniref:porin n=1 Tax=Geomonas sp. RF6 TaxID=2897342 RepID=UPI001E5ECDAE|nr:porin [Geomonas sp. RF6]UFS71350.1 cytochrome C [Geomonas sp. RF6]
MFSKSRLALAALSLTAAALLPLVAPSPSHAIPAYARQHKTECSTCHTIYPELNEFGEAYLRNSYVWPSGAHAAPAGKGEAQRTEGLWLSGIPEMLPVSFTATIDAAYNSRAVDELDLSSRSIRLQASSAFRDVAAFYLTYNLYAQDLQTGAHNNPNNASPDINELFAIWRHALKTPVNVRIGRMEPKLSLWKKSNRVITVPSFASTTYTQGQGGSQWSVDTPQDALEVNSLIGDRVLVSAGVANRKGQNSKDYYGHISGRFGGTDFSGHEPEVDLEKEATVWDYLGITVGAFGYSGHNGVIDAFGVAQERNNFYRAGAEIDLLYKRLHLKGSGVLGRDTNPDLSAGGSALHSHAVTVEGEYMFGAPVDVVALMRYDYFYNLQGATRRYIPAVAYTPLQNTKLSLEYIYEDGAQAINRTTLASLAFSF